MVPTIPKAVGGKGKWMDTAWKQWSLVGTTLAAVFLAGMGVQDWRQDGTAMKALEMTEDHKLEPAHREALEWRIQDLERFNRLETKLDMLLARP